jgi:hypothetical protein
MKPAIHKLTGERMTLIKDYGNGLVKCRLDVPERVIGWIENDIRIVRAENLELKLL